MMSAGTREARLCRGFAIRGTHALMYQAVWPNKPPLWGVKQRCWSAIERYVHSTTSEGYVGRGRKVIPEHGLHANLGQFSGIS
jgi:hypothetical protein